VLPIGVIKNDDHVNGRTCLFGVMGRKVNRRCQGTVSRYAGQISQKIGALVDTNKGPWGRRLYFLYFLYLPLFIDTVI